MAERAGVPLHVLMGWPGPMTHRQFEAWRRWRREDLNRPSRTDFYLMQIACEVRTVLRSLAGGGRHLDLNEFRLRFGRPSRAPRRASGDEIKSIIMGSLGVAPPPPPADPAPPAPDAEGG